MAAEGPTLPASFGRYTLLERLAVGGMAEIFKAKISGAHGFEKVVVIKRILPHLAADPSFLDMFITEAKLTVELVHPKIVQVFEFGDVESQLYIALEYVDGLDALALLRACAHKRVRLPARLAVYIAAEVLDALDYAHRAVSATGQPLGIVHRDISPSNVFISRRGDVKLGDFGIARVTERTSKTQAGTLKGKYGYMSPEQVIGGDLDGRSDIFSVGIVLAEMLMGRRLFVAPGDLDVLLMVRDARLDRFDKYGGDIEPELRALVVRSLARLAADRCQTAGELRDGLLDWLLMRRQRVSASDLAAFLASLYDSAAAPSAVAAAPPVPQGTIAGPTTRAAQEAHAALLAAARLATADTPVAPVPDTPPLPPPPVERGREAPPSGTRGRGSPWPQMTPRSGVGPSPMSVADQLAVDPAAEMAQAPLTPVGLDDMPTPPPRTASGETIDDAIKWALDSDVGTPTAERLGGASLTPVTTPGRAHPPAPVSPPDLDEVELDIDEEIPIHEAPEEAAPRTVADEDGAFIEIGDSLEVLEPSLPPPAPAPVAAPASTVEPPVYGDLEITTPVKLFCRLAVARDAGLVVLECGGIVKEVYLVNGAPEYVTSNLAHELLGEYLVSQNVISAGEQSMALAMMPRFGGKLGDTLVGLGLMRPLEVFRHLTRQVRSKLIDIYSWQKGRYRYERGKTNAREAFPLGLDAFEIIGAGVVTLSLPFLRSRYRPLWGMSPRAVPNPPVPPEVFRLGPGPRELYHRLDGRRRLEDWVAYFASETELLNFYRTFYLLIETGLVEL
ncbi:MAG TPA: protein kinase [Polyangia bacterium]|jgi:serine/threonine protein kinase